MLPISPAYKTYTGRDSGVFQYIAWRWLEGEVPYKDVWDHKPPVIYALNAAALWLTNQSPWGIWGLEIIFLAISVFLLFQVIRRLFSEFSALISIFSFVLTYPYLLSGGNLTTEYTVLFTIVIYYIYWFHQDKKNSYLAIGFLTGVSFFTKQNAIAVGVTVALITFYTYFSRQIKFDQFVSKILLLLSGFFLAIFPFLIYFSVNNALPDFWDAVFRYNFAYINSSKLDKVDSLLHTFRILSSSGFTFFWLISCISSLVYCIYGKRNHPQDTKIYIFVILNSLMELLFVATSGRTYNHYYLSLLPIITFSFGHFLNFFETELLRNLSKKTVIIPLKTFLSISFLFGILVTQLNNMQRDAFFPFADVNSSQRIDSLIEIIYRESSPEDTILFIGGETSINMMTGRKSPTKYTYQFPLVTEGYFTEANIQEFIEDIYSNQPSLIIDTKHEWLNTDKYFRGYNPFPFRKQLAEQSFWVDICQLELSIGQGGEIMEAPSATTWDIYQCRW